MSASNENTPVATIVVTTYDRPQLVGDAVASALGQTRSDIEVIVVDDGSSDDYLSNRWQDRRLRAVGRTSRGGPCIARNLGLDMARGRWITFLDDDDELLPHMVDASLRAAHASLVPGPVAIWSAKGRKTAAGDITRTDSPFVMPIGTYGFLGENDFNSRLFASNTLFVETHLLRSIGGWDSSIEYAEQLELFLRLNRTCSIDVAPEVTYLTTGHDGVRQSHRVAERGDAFMRISRRHGDVLAQYPSAHSLIVGNAVHSYLEAGMWAEAMRSAAHGVAVGARDPRSYIRLLLSLAGPHARRIYVKSRS